MSQQIRPSQFMFTYGPGAVIESPSGPVVVRDLLKLKGRLEEEGGFKTLGLEHFEIEDPRLTGRPPFAGSPTRDIQAPGECGNPGASGSEADLSDGAVPPVVSV
jgi:hypothetical protein